MTKEEIKEAAKVMEAYANGKEIQYFDTNNGWITTPNPLFNWMLRNYRIKPEPKYRPFKTQEECWEEMHKHPDFGWIKNSNELIHICNIFKANDNVIIDFHSDLHYTINVVKVFNKYTFTDGTPFGIKEE